MARPGRSGRAAGTAGAVGLTQLLGHPRTYRRSVPAGPDLHRAFGLDLGPFRLDAPLPDCARPALAEYDHERGRCLPFGEDRRRLVQLPPGIVLPVRGLLTGGTRPEAGHGPVNDRQVSLGELAEAGDVSPVQGPHVLACQALDRAQIAGHRKLLSSLRLGGIRARYPAGSGPFAA